MISVFLGSIFIITFSDQAQVTLQLTVFPIYCKGLLAGPPLLEGPKKYFYRYPKPLSAALGDKHQQALISTAN
jgi:hypothetical protein